MRIADQTLDQERALYGLDGAEVVDCTFAGPADGESALKECANLQVRGCQFDLRYPLWHVRDAALEGCAMSQTCRAALWYDQRIRLEDCTLGGIKALRECSDVQLNRCRIQSPEFGWQCDGVSMTDCTLEAEYPFLHSRGMTFDHLELTGKYSFQYVEDVVIRNSVLNTKDAFWHSRNVTVYDSVVRGEYLAWYAQNLRLVRCKVIGTQPLCYVQGLVMEDCEMEGADFAFEYSDVQATLRGEVVSVKNPWHGFITADRIGEIILDAYQKPDADCRIQARQG